jgi:hypothetical protein
LQREEVEFKEISRKARYYAALMLTVSLNNQLKKYVRKQR